MKYTIKKFQGGGEFEEYLIKKGDTLTKISRETGISINDLVKANNIKDPDKIYYDRILKIPKTIKKEELKSKVEIKNPIDEKKSIEANRTVTAKSIGGAPRLVVPVNLTTPSFKFPAVTPAPPAPVREKNKTQSKLASKQGDIITFSQKTIPDRILPAKLIPSKPPQSEQNIPQLSLRTPDSFAQTLDNTMFKNIARAIGNPTLDKTPLNIKEIVAKSTITPTASPKKSQEPSLEDYLDMGRNWISRQASKLGLIDDPDSNLTPTETKIKGSEYSIIPPSYTGDTVPYSRHGMPGRYYLPESIDLTSVKLGARNREDDTPINSPAGIITATNKFLPKSAYTNQNRTYVGIDSKGNFKAGAWKDFSDDDIMAPTYVNRIKNFIYDDKGNIEFKPEGQGNNKPIPKVLVDEDGKSVIGSMNLLTWGDQGDANKYGDLTGGRVVIRAGNETRLVSGSIKDIEQEMNAMKKRNNTDYVDAYTMDNGSYNLAFRSFDKKMSSKQLSAYDNLNQGGGNFLYVKPGPTNNFKSDTLWTPNVRDENDESYKKGHGLVNEKKGVVLHHTGFTGDGKGALNYMMNPKNEAAAHVFINYDGSRTVMATPDQVAFHAGSSKFNGRENVNDFMLGIEFQGNTQTTPLTSEQIQSGIEYLKPIIQQYKIPKEWVTTHTRVRDNYNKGKFIWQKAPAKNDLTEGEYERFINELIRNVYYKNVE